MQHTGEKWVGSKQRGNGYAVYRREVDTTGSIQRSGGYAAQKGQVGVQQILVGFLPKQKGKTKIYFAEISLKGNCKKDFFYQNSQAKQNKTDSKRSINRSGHSVNKFTAYRGEVGMHYQGRCGYALLSERWVSSIPGEKWVCII